MFDKSWNCVTTKEAARQLGVSTDAIIRYYHSGILRGRKHGRNILIEQGAVIALMHVIRQAATGESPTPPVRKKSASAAEAPVAEAS